jgi:hypothetical protein
LVLVVWPDASVAADTNLEMSIDLDLRFANDIICTFV